MHSSQVAAGGDAAAADRQPHHEGAVEQPTPEAVRGGAPHGRRAPEPIFPDEAKASIAWKWVFALA